MLVRTCIFAPGPRRSDSPGGIVERAARPHECDGSGARPCLRCFFAFFVCAGLDAALHVSVPVSSPCHGGFDRPPAPWPPMAILISSRGLCFLFRPALPRCYQSFLGFPIAGRITPAPLAQWLLSFRQPPALAPHRWTREPLPAADSPGAAMDEPR
jgi:hypothetical protein